MTGDVAGRARRRLSSWIGLTLLAFNIVSAGLIAPGQINPAFAQEIDGEHIVICTGAGMIVLDKDGHPIDGQAGGEHPSFCVFCLPLMHGTVDGPALTLAAIDAPLVSEPEIPQLVVDSLPARNLRLSGASTPRAPPIV